MANKKGIIWIVILVVILAGSWLVWGNDKETLDDVAQTTDIQDTTTASSTNEVATTTETETQINNLDNNQEKIMNATLHTNKGDIKIEFLDAIAPNTVANFTKLAKAGFYDGVKFHRVIKDFMIQGGDPFTKDDTRKSDWGKGDPGYKFADEITGESKNNTGTVAMANSGANTNGSQFYINVKDNNFLDGKYTVFARVTAGMDVVTAIENTPTDSSDRPLEAVVIESVTLE